MTYHIAMIDDNPAEAAYARLICEDWAKTAGHILLCHEFSSAEQFLFHAEDLPAFDILLLDIEMGRMNGVDLARRVREYDSRVQMVFITGYPDFIAEGYEVSALHYLMKPVKREKLFGVLDRAASALGKQTQTVLLPVGKEFLCLPTDGIRYAESQGHYAGGRAQMPHAGVGASGTFGRRLCPLSPICHCGTAPRWACDQNGGVSDRRHRATVGEGSV